MKNPTLMSVMMTGLLLHFVAFSFSQRSNESFELLLKFGNVNLTENVRDYVAGFDATGEQAIDGYFYKIIQFRGIPAHTEVLDMEASGLQFLEYIPNKAYIVAIPAAYDMASLLDRNVRNISDIIPEFKQDMYLLDKDYPEWALRGDGQIDLVVSYYRNLPFDATTMELSPLVRDVIQNDPLGNFQVLRVDVSDIDAIIALPQVCFVEPFYPDGEPENYTGKTLHRSNVLDSQYETGRHYDGSDVKVMLQDDGIIGPHIDYQGRIGSQNLTYNYGNHGDHCAGTIFGSGNLDPTAAGMAPGAELHTWGAAPGYPGFNDIANAYTNTGIRISSTSYSDGCNAGYTSLARTMDIQVHTYESLMHVFSAGNAGTQNCGYGAGSGWGNITGGHKVGKNVIATANLTLTGGLSGSSSRGPAHDGRIKPDISAKGTNVVSTIDPHDYASFTGTSMACPGIAGSLAQLYQAYKELNGGTEPPGGLMKGLILNTADDLGNTGPDFLFGWGHINNLKAVEALENETYMSGEVSQGETNTHTLTVPEGVKEMKVMVYWTDKEASVSASVALVNNLDITITDPGNEDHYPWLLNHYPHADSLSLPAEKGVDALNNVEQVQVDDPAAGTYTLNVGGTEVPFGPQEYFVIYQFTYEDIKLTYPLGGESFGPNEQVLVRWDAHGDEDPFALEYTLDGGSTWELVSDNISADQRYYYWTTPAEISGDAWLRLARNDQESMSEAAFSIMGVTEDIWVARACEESVLLRWEPVDGAESYDVYLLGEKYMEVVGNTANDSLFIQDINFEEEYWFSVSAIGTGDAKGRRAVAIMKEPGTWDCLITKDLAVGDVISPPLGTLFDCQAFDDLHVQVELTNMATDDMTDITVSYEFDGGPAVSETFTGVLAAGETMVYEFASTVTVPATGVFEMTVWIESDGDQNDDNNMQYGTTVLLPSNYLDNGELITLDEYGDCSTDPGCEDVSCVLDDHLVNLENNLNDDIDWRVLGGLTPTPFTGPLGDHSTGTTGKYLYLEASGDCVQREAILTTSCIDLTGSSAPALTFWYSMNGAEMGSLHVDIVSGGVLHKDVIDPVEGDQGYDWHQAQVDLSPYAGQVVLIRFRGVTGNGELSDMALDDLMVTEMTGIGEDAAFGGFTVYPNPSSGVCQVTANVTIPGQALIRVLDLSGRTVHAQTIESLQAGSVLTIDIADLGNGMYYLLVEGDDRQYKEKLLKY